MSKRPSRRAVEELLRRGLEARAASISPSPDPVDLARRIERAEASSGRGRLLATAAAVVVAAAVGGGVGAALVPSPPAQHLSAAAKTGSQAGPLPRGPQVSRRHRSPRAAGPSASAGPVVALARETSSGARLVATPAQLAPVAITSGSSPSGCFAAELVSTSASSDGAVAGATGVVDLQPLAADGLELVDSGTAPAEKGVDLWWATVAVGSKVARVAAEQPNGSIDAMKPVGGIAVLGGLVPTQSADGFFSLVAETPSGRPIHSIGFLAGSGPKAWGAASAPKSTASGCLTPGSGAGLLSTLASQPASPLLAGSSVLASFHQAYTAGLPAGLAENVATVVAGSGLLRAAGAIAKRPTTGAGSPGPAALADQVEVARVAFLSSARAEVIYRAASGGWRTGMAVLGGSGIWKVSRTSFCGSLTGGLPPSGSELSPLARACSKS